MKIGDAYNLILNWFEWFYSKKVINDFKLKMYVSDYVTLTLSIIHLNWLSEDFILSESNLENLFFKLIDEFLDLYLAK